MSFWRDIGATRISVLLAGAALILVAGASIFWIFPYSRITYSDRFEVATTSAEVRLPPKMIHIPTPTSVRGIYMTACTASVKRLREKTLAYFDGSDLNTLVIDFKDYTGTVSYVSTSSDIYSPYRISSQGKLSGRSSLAELSTSTKMLKKSSSTISEPQRDPSVPVIPSAFMPTDADGAASLEAVDVSEASSTASQTESMLLSEQSGRGCRVKDLPDFLNELHDRGIYTIARITVFQDPFYSKIHPELAVQSKSHPDYPWRDKHGLSYIDPGASPYWDYIVDMGKQAYGIGFDELNFDYIRFPSDGDMSDVSYSWSGKNPKEKVLQGFFAYLYDNFGGTDVPISADLFGLTTSATGDMGIGQVLEDALKYFDYVSPMVYPSHFGSGFIGLANPADHPYDVVRYSMDHAAAKALAASSTPDKLRPWLQDFDLGATYTVPMIRDQIKATDDAGLNSWLLWNAASVYHKEAVTSTSSEIIP